MSRDRAPPKLSHRTASLSPNRTTRRLQPIFQSQRSELPLQLQRHVPRLNLQIDQVPDSSLYVHDRLLRDTELNLIELGEFVTCQSQDRPESSVSSNHNSSSELDNLQNLDLLAPRDARLTSQGIG